MTTAQIEATTKRMAEKGIDARTIGVHFEVALNRPLTEDEAKAVIEGWRASAPVRYERQKKADAAAAEQLRQR